eukprot:6214810-Pleurochrysis_carterae.AAC.7
MVDIDASKAYSQQECVPCTNTIKTKRFTVLEAIWKNGEEQDERLSPAQTISLSSAQWMPEKDGAPHLALFIGRLHLLQRLLVGLRLLLLRQQHLSGARRTRNQALPKSTESSRARVDTWRARFGYVAWRATSGYVAWSATFGYVAWRATLGYVAWRARSGYVAWRATFGHVTWRATFGYVAWRARSGYVAWRARSGYVA